MGKGTDRADATEKKSGSRKNRPPKSGGVRLPWKKENQGSRPTRHREVRKCCNDLGTRSPTEAQLEPPGAHRIEKGRKKRKKKGHGKTMQAKKVEAKEGGGLALGR